MSNPPQLVILYHREPYDEVIENGRVRLVEKAKPNGIVPTLKSFLEASPGGKWVAWRRHDPTEPTSFNPVAKVEKGRGVHEVHRVPLTSEEIESFYHVTSKEAFWPILHTFPWQFSYESSDWDTFVDINAKFAEAACNEAEEDAVFWIHDYNLWMTPRYIRARKPNSRIIFFHHTPFPSPDVFNILPWREAILDSLLDCNLVGFHVPRYVQNFAACARSLRGVEVEEERSVGSQFVGKGTALAEPRITSRLRHGDRYVDLDAFPVGTNPRLIRSYRDSETTQRRIREIREETAGNRVILSAGRIDYTKGVKETLMTFERLLERRPEQRGKLNLVVVAVAPASGMTVYEEARAEIEQIVGKINGHFARLNWTPVLLFTRSLPFEELVAYMAASHIAWITPLRDGHNLVAKEYIVARQGHSGVLVLSEFAGAAVELADAVHVNPYAAARMDAAMDEALDMCEQEQLARMDRMLGVVERNNVSDWASRMFQHRDIAGELAEQVHFQS